MKNIYKFIENLSQFREKTINGFSPDRSRITYTQKQTFYFDKEASDPLTEDDRIIMLNVHMNVSYNNFFKFFL